MPKYRVHYIEGNEEKNIVLNMFSASQAKGYMITKHGVRVTRVTGA